MATCILVNKLGDKKFTSYLPSTATNAQDFANLLDGEWFLYDRKATSGNDLVTGEYKHATIMLKDDSTKKKTYFRCYIKATKNEDDIISALQGKTINGVHADAVYVLNLTWQGTPAQSGGGSGGNP